MVTHLTTNQPVHSLNLAERTGCLVLCDLWSYVLVIVVVLVYVQLQLGFPYDAWALDSDSSHHMSVRQHNHAKKKSIAAQMVAKRTISHVHIDGGPVPIRAILMIVMEVSAPTVDHEDLVIRRINYYSAKRKASLVMSQKFEDDRKPCGCWQTHACTTCR
ncbi:uncharacterized protein K452DRAFT_11265 [Aplosporella prunicola CBS 121167]|uniref:Uncharacterized protein n=1 Tax=Aplosporella prunicola CBS 121167 TaxID=1176127 RepID=A0A6A6BF71_9PEZI|nr:uncharacterized protein K452DRAFT_11265 [Aplosporella prunicola CBS 121167]KAF2142822.1 hypothetical protein K452DRAFT_11265 [Aplosporella prunicola CBS 121167]